MDIRYRLYVGHSMQSGAEIEESKVVGVILHSLEREGFPGATIINALGVWDGGKEDSSIVEIIADAGDESKVRNLGHYLGRTLWQDEVLLTSEPIRCETLNTRS